jgi:F420-0:gamma-glutamyl ligase-like protein
MPCSLPQGDSFIGSKIMVLKFVIGRWRMARRGLLPLALSKSLFLSLQLKLEEYQNELTNSNFNLKM